MDIANDVVLRELFRGMRNDWRAVMCSVAGDPSTVDDKRWGGIPWALGAPCRLLPSMNNYVAISSFRGGPDGYRRRRDQFGALHAIMIDDVGTKVALSALPTELISPTMAVETSPGNFQVTYMLETPVEDEHAASDVIKQIIERVTGGGADPGMAGITRVLRLPVGTNGKPQHTSWKCRCVLWRPDIRTSWDDIYRGFGLVHRLPRPVAVADSAVTAERVRGFRLVETALKELRIVKRAGRGWMDIRCPWVREHTGGADTGAAVAYPAAANGWYGGFKCHHGHCESRGWADLEDWVCSTVVAEGHRTRGSFDGHQERGR